MKTIEKHLKLKEEERKLKQKIDQDVKGKSEDEEYRQLYGYSRDEWYGDKVDDWNRMKTIEKHLKLKEEERKLKQKIDQDVKGKSEDEE